MGPVLPVLRVSPVRLRSSDRLRHAGTPTLHPENVLAVFKRVLQLNDERSSNECLAWSEPAQCSCNKCQSSSVGSHTCSLDNRTTTMFDSFGAWAFAFFLNTLNFLPYIILTNNFICITLLWDCCCLFYVFVNYTTTFFMFLAVCTLLWIIWACEHEISFLYHADDFTLLGIFVVFVGIHAYFVSLLSVSYLP